MIRLIKRYGSRKLYDTEESRYVSLEEIGDWVRQGQQVQVVDNQNGDDVTAQTLTQVILEEGKRGMSPVSSDFLHALIRRGEQMVSTGVESLSQGVDRLLQASVDRVGPLRELRDEVKQMRAKIDVLESAISEIEEGREPSTNGDRHGACAVRPAGHEKEGSIVMNMKQIREVAQDLPTEVMQAGRQVWLAGLGAAGIVTTGGEAVFSMLVEEGKRVKKLDRGRRDRRARQRRRHRRHAGEGRREEDRRDRPVAPPRRCWPASASRRGRKWRR